MSTGEYGRQRSKSSNSKRSYGSRPTPPPTALTPENIDGGFEPCAATASFFLYSQRNVVLVLHHDTLAIERRFDLHREDVQWIAVDCVSERGSGRLAVSYDAGNTAIVWDILSGGEIARFSAYEHMRVATFMRNGNIAFGNDQGNMILFEPPTSEHIAARTIFDPITSIAPSADCRTFAIGYLNGSILIATLQPSFTILHTLTTTRAPSRITGLAWHGSSSRYARTRKNVLQWAMALFRIAHVSLSWIAVSWSIPGKTRAECHSFALHALPLDLEQHANRSLGKKQICSLRKPQTETYESGAYQKDPLANHHRSFVYFSGPISMHRDHAGLRGRKMVALFNMLKGKSREIEIA